MGVQSPSRHHRCGPRGPQPVGGCPLLGRLSQSRISRLVARYRAEGEAAFEPRSRRPKRPPLEACKARPKATPEDRTADRHVSVRRDRVDKGGKVTLRIDGELYSIGLGRRLGGTRVTMLVCDLEVRVVDETTGELIRELTINPNTKFQARGVPRGRPPRSAH